MQTPWIAFDCETTGLDPGCRLVELAALAFDCDGEILDRFSSLMRPDIPVLPDIEALIGLDAATLAQAPDPRQVLASFRDWLPDRGTLIAHNATFDVNVLGFECERLRRARPKLPVVDSLRLAKALPDAPSGRLQELVQHYGWTTDGPAHRALPDADATRQLVIEAQTSLPPERFAKLMQARPFANSWHFPRRWEDRHRALPAAQAAGEALHIRYVDNDGSTTERWVSPHGYAQTGQGCRFHGWCHLREGRRLFALERTTILAGPVDLDA